MLRLGLLGYPLEHSFSPLLHNAVLSAMGIKGYYELYVAPPQERSRMISKLIHELRNGEIAGFNVTIPYKQEIMEYVDIVDPLALSVGAINTVGYREGKVWGYNTDVSGFLSDLEQVGWLNEIMKSQSSVLILGAGGSARAVGYALLSRGIKVIFTARRAEQAENIVSAWRLKFPGLMEYKKMSVSNLRSLNQPISMLVNCTPVGMWPEVEESPWPDKLALPAGVRVYDLVYNPIETALLSKAERNGHQARNGLGMLVEQAALSLETWTGRKAPQDVMWETLQSKLK